MTPGTDLALVFSGLIGLLLGAAGAALAARATRAQIAERLAGAVRERDATAKALDREREQRQAERAENARLETRLDAERSQTARRVADLTEARAALTDQFKTLSQEILEEKSARFSAHSKADLAALITPLREHIGRFEHQVKTAYDTENRQRSALAEQVRALEASNRAIAEDAANLATALKGETKTQGNWGEMILETVLERSGLEKGAQYDTQVATRSDSGARLIPDAVVYLPEDRGIVIDSKVSLTAYIRVHEAADEQARRRALAEHLSSVKRHLKDLSAKNYQNNDTTRTLDYVFMFVPSEAAYVEALRADFDLQRQALDCNIALVSPTTLMPMLRAVANLWRLEKQEKNAEAIAKRAGALHDKFVGFIADLDRVSRGLETVNKSFAQARNKLTDGQGNLVRQAQRLQSMGAKTSKTIDRDWQRAAALGADRAAARPDADDAHADNALGRTGTDNREDL